MSRPHKKSVTHHLLTIALGRDTNLHCYLMSSKKSDTLDAAKLLLVEAEKMSSRVVPAVMVTPLGESGIRVVREIMALNEEARRVLHEARDFHIAVFCTSEDDKLMALH
jgi:hypothetical protein